MTQLPSSPRTSPSRLSLCAIIALGSALGGALRLLASDAASGLMPADLPLGTLFVNVTGSFVIGFYARRISSRAAAGRVAPMQQRHFVMTGLCGGYTTFSAFSLETLHRLQTQAWGPAALNVALSIVGWLLAAWLGFALAARLDPAWRRPPPAQ